MILLNLAAASAPSQTYSVLHSFGGSTNADGDVPAANLVLADDTLYGTTVEGGSSNYGTIFKINTDGSGYEVIHHCVYPDTYPRGPFVLAGATLYCATEGGAQEPGPGYPLHEWTESRGSAFSVNTNGGSFSRLLEWGTIHYAGQDDILYGPSEKAQPQSGLALSGENLYGTVQDTLFTVRTNGGAFAVLQELSGQSRTGVTVSNGILFGTTFDGGSSNYGTIFTLEITNSSYAVLKHFTGVDGITPEGALMFAGTTLYGTTESGGEFGYGTVYRIKTDGGEFSVLRHFSGSDGAYPHSALALSGEKLFGTTGAGGEFNHGTIFQINTDGTGFAVLKHFNGEDGAEPSGGVILSGPTLYGTTADGGEFDKGVVFRLSLAPSLLNPCRDGTNFTFSFQTVSNVSYTVECTGNLTTTNWLPHHALTGDGSVVPCVVPMTNGSPCFFRLQTQ